MNARKRLDFANKIALTFGGLTGAPVNLDLLLIRIIERARILMSVRSLKILSFALEHVRTPREVTLVLVLRVIHLVLMKEIVKVSL